MSVREGLQAIGAVPQGGGFNQDSFRTHDIIEGVDLTDGYCAGVVLDWTRRVLQPNTSKSADPSRLEYATTKMAENVERQTAALRRMAKGYGGSATSYVNETERTKLCAILQMLKNEGVEVNYDVYGIGVPISSDIARLMSQVWTIPGVGNNLFSRFNLSNEPAGTLSRVAIGNLLNQLGSMADPQTQARAAGGREWASFAAELDERFKQIRISDVRQVTRKPFSNLHVVRSSPSKQYESAGVWSYELKTDGLQLNCCTIVSMKPTSGSTGHQIAIHQTLQNEFFLFDPNYGAFKCTASVLKNCMQQLFWIPFLKYEETGNQAKINISGNLVPTVDGDKAVYCRRKNPMSSPTGEWKAMGYTVFEKID